MIFGVRSRICVYYEFKMSFGLQYSPNTLIFISCHISSVNPKRQKTTAQQFLNISPFSRAFSGCQTLKNQVLWFKMLSFLDCRFCHWKTTISSPCHPRWTHFLKRKQHSSFAVSLDALHWTPGWGLNFARSTTNWGWFVGFIVSLYDYRGSWTCS